VSHAFGSARGAAIIVAVAAICSASIALSVVAQTTTKPAVRNSAPVDSAKADSADSAKAAPTHRSRFGRFGRAIGKAAGTVEARTGISRETAARIALTAATGGAGALLNSRNGIASGAASAATSSAMQALRTSGSSSAATAMGGADDAARSAMLRSLQARKAPGSAPAGLAQQALQATTYLAHESALASNGDPVARNAFKVLNAKMSATDGELAAMQARATAGDATAAQEMIIREAAIVRDAASGKP
jgi:hypothetical protein